MIKFSKSCSLSTSLSPFLKRSKQYRRYIIPGSFGSQRQGWFNKKCLKCFTALQISFQSSIKYWKKHSKGTNLTKCKLNCFAPHFQYKFLKTCFYVFKGDYDVVINDYEKAKSLFGKTEVQVFKKCEFGILLNLILILVGKINMRANSKFLSLLNSFIFLYNICSIWNAFLNCVLQFLPWKYILFCIVHNKTWSW